MANSTIRRVLALQVGAILSMLVACGRPDADPRKEWREVEQVRQALGTSWTGPWGSNTEVAYGNPATRGRVGGNWVYANIASVLSATNKYSDSDAAWATGLTSAGYIYGRPAAVETKNTAGGNKCDLVAWRNGSAQMVWQVEAGGINDYCALDYNLIAPVTVSGTISSDPAVVSWESGSNQIYWAFSGANSGNCAGGGYCLLYTTYSNSSATSGSFTSWTERTDGTLGYGSSPAAISMTTDRIDIFVRGTDDGLHTRTVTISGGTPTWGGFSGLNGVLASNPSVGSKSSTHMKVCVQGSDTEVHCQTYSSGSWSGFAGCGSPSGNGIIGAPSVTTDGTDYWIFAVGTDYKLYARVCN